MRVPIPQNISIGSFNKYPSTNSPNDKIKYAIFLTIPKKRHKKSLIALCMQLKIINFI